MLLARRWTFAREQITFAVTPPPDAADASTDDNQVTVDSGALSLILTVEPGLYDWMLQQDRPGEAFAQREVERWNAILARAVHPLSPQGALDRIRLDEVRLLPDGTQIRGEDFMLWDFYWSFRTVGSGTQFLSRGADDRVWMDQTIVLHELMHQRGLTDLYDYDVWHRFGVAEVGIMEGARADLTAHSTFGLNLWAGRRTPVHLDRFGNRINQLTILTLSQSYLGCLPIIPRVRTPQARGYAFLPVYYLNLLHFEGRHDQAALEIPVVMHRW